MPVPIADQPPPKPPTVFVPVVKGPWEDIAKAQALSINWEHALLVWLTNQLKQMRDTLNWLIQQTGIRNLIPDSDVKDPATYWTVGAGVVVTDGVGFGGGRGFSVTGGPVTADVVSSAIVVVPGGQQYVLSGWIDASLMTAGTVSWLVRDTFSLVTIAEVVQQIGQSSRLEVLAEISAATVSVDVVFRLAGAIGDVIASQPQLELPALAGHVGPTRPAASLYRSNVGAN